jgi:hypothetical protein
MRIDILIAIAAFLAVLLFFAVLSYIGYDRWEDISP